MTDRFEELLWAEHDEELSVSEAGELAALRAAANASRQEGAQAGAHEVGLEAEIRHLAARLDEVEDLEAPPELKGLILGAIDQGGRQTPKSESVPRSGLSPFEHAATGPAPAMGGAWLRWGYLAAGFLLGAGVVYQFAFGPELSPEQASELVGTVIPVPEPAPEGTTSPTAMPVFVHLSARGSRLAASLELGSGLSTIIFSAPGLEVERVDFQEGATGSYEFDSGQVVLQVTGPGRVELSLALAEMDQPFAFSVFGSGIEPFEGEFFLHQLSGS